MNRNADTPRVLIAAGTTWLIASRARKWLRGNRSERSAALSVIRRRPTLYGVAFRDGVLHMPDHATICKTMITGGAARPVLGYAGNPIPGQWHPVPPAIVVDGEGLTVGGRAA